MDTKYFFETGVYRPPSEGGSFSLLLRITRNCPWNRCTFCSMYKEEKYKLRSVEELKSDIDAISDLCDRLKMVSSELGYGGKVNREVVLKLIGEEPVLGGHHGFVMVANWVISGGETAFLQDANSLNMRSEHFIEILQYIRQRFPTLKRVTTYARSKTIAKKTSEELKNIRMAGLDRLHVGLESGDDDILKKIKKGVTSDEHIIAGKMAIDAGFQLSEYWMPGLGGKKRWKQHAENTARVLNEINPHYARSRPFFPVPGTPLSEEIEKGELQLLEQGEQLMELKRMVEELTFKSKLCFDHDANHWVDEDGRRLFSLDYEGYQFPEKKDHLLQLINRGIRALPS